MLEFLVVSGSPLCYYIEAQLQNGHMTGSESLTDPGDDPLLLGAFTASPCPAAAILFTDSTDRSEGGLEPDDTRNGQPQ